MIEKVDSLVKRLMQREQYDRRIEVLMDRMLRFYKDGVQHIYPNWSTGVYQIGVSGGYIDIGNGQSVQCPLYMGAYNIFRSRWRSLDAVLTQNPPGIDFAADKAGVTEDIEAAEAAEGYWQLFQQHNSIKEIQQAISYMFGMSGRCVVWSRTVKSKARFGTNNDGSPRAMETAQIYGSLGSKLCIASDSWEHCSSLFLMDDIDSLIAKSENDWIRSKIVDGEGALGESDWDRFARIGVRQSKKGTYLTGLATNFLVTEMNGFLRPSVFEDKEFDDPYPGAKETDVTEDGKPFTYRDQFNKLFPDGMHVKYIGKTYSESWNECPDDVIDVGFPDKQNGMTGGALMEPMKVIQDTFNDYMNAKRENYETGWSVTYFRGSDEDYQAICNQRSRPNDYILLKEGPAEQEIAKSVVHREDPASAPVGFDQAIEELRGVVSQDITGALPALQGTANRETTASQQAMDRSQAMGMLGPAWANEQKLFCGFAKKCALLASKNPDHGEEITTVGRDGKNVTVQLEKITKGKFHSHTTESNFPETVAAKRANLQDLIKMAAASPIGATIFESPDNWEEFVEVFGDSDLTLIPAIAYKKQTREIDLLLQQPPIIPTSEEIAQAAVQHAQQQIQAEQQAAQTGMPFTPQPFQPPQPQPSLIPEADDYHQWESAKCQEYLSGEDCWIRMTIPRPQPGQNPDEALQQAKLGIQNVRLHKAVHDQFLQQQQLAKAQMQQMVKPPSESINFKDEDAAGRQQMNAQAGIKEAAPEANKQVQTNAAAPGMRGTATV